MGYILPIENYQAQQYQNRVSQPDRNPYPVERLYPVHLDMNYEHAANQNEKNRFFHMDKDLEFGTQPGVTQQMRIPAVVDRIYAEMTGVGQTISTYV